MSMFEISRVTARSETACIGWEGAFRGQVRLSLMVHTTCVKICLAGTVQRIGGFDECFDATASCFTLLDTAVGKIKASLSEIEWEDDLPATFRVKLVLDPTIGSALVLANRRISLVGLTGGTLTEPLETNKDVQSSAIVVVPVAAAE